MFRYEDGADITDEEFKLYIKPFEDKCCEYLESEILPLYISFYLATWVDMNLLLKNSFKIYMYSAADMINMSCRDYETLKAKVVDILYNRYKLKVISEDPLNFEEVK